ncbi:hypothetical protein A9995_06435 [Erythrobacter sp. QSSC1-22B]|uniref:hypothetical protein n=1 Tax=Erythrobacter sp. QSSC1-22B TaxID=1860125 RepID=UPI0008050026|nr:hypothetical protein [Erythrobacter sp. QSSC1-22B]OBX19401.1 hypothetical protein A9995_06435 [Erythrobacter sp. QSSC1-22B]
MRRLIFAATAVPLACLAVPALAQDIDQTPVAEAEALDRMAQGMSDPVRQAQLAATLAALTEIVLDIPLAPIVEPLAEAAGEMAGEPSPRIDPDLTLRRMAPRSDDLSRTIQDRLPQVMDRMAGLSGSLAALVPALRDMADQLEVALPPAESPPTR